MSSYNLDIDARDLSEAPRLAKDSQSRGVVIGACVAALLFLALLVYGSLPELSPHEIVAMEGYAGEQPTRHIFNIHSLDGTDDQPAVIPSDISAGESSVATADIDTNEIKGTGGSIAVAKTMETTPAEKAEPVAVVSEAATVAPVVTETAEVTAEVKQRIEVPVTREHTQAVQVAVEEQVSPKPDTTGVVAVARIAEAPTVRTAANRTEPTSTLFGTAQQERVVAAMATTPTIDEASDTVVVSSVAAMEPMPMPASSNPNQRASVENGRGKLLPLRSVLADYTELKASPSDQSKTILSLGRGVVVTAFERYGEWIHIGTNDGSSITGYVLESSLGRVGTRTSG